MSARSKVLIVDQEKIIGDLLASAFPADHFHVFNAASSSEASRLAGLHGPDLVVVDPSVPDGFELIDSLRASGARRVIVLSGCPETLKKARARGIEMIIDKKEGLPRLAEVLRSAGFNLLSIGQKGRILIVDDEPDIRALVSTFLTQRGYTCISAASGFDALELLPQDVSQMVLLVDIMMPQMGGLELLKHVKSRHPRLTVIVMTAVCDREIARRALELGAFDYLIKPMDLEALEGSIVVALSHDEYQRKPWWKRLGA